MGGGGTTGSLPSSNPQISCENFQQIMRRPQRNQRKSTFQTQEEQKHWGTAFLSQMMHQQEQHPGAAVGICCFPGGRKPANSRSVGGGVRDGGTLSIRSHF